MMLQETHYCFDARTGMNHLSVRIIAHKEQSVLVDAHGLSLHVKAPASHKVSTTLCVKPSCVILVDEYLPDASVNTFYGRVITVQEQEALVAVDVDINDVIIRAVMMKSFSEHLSVQEERIIAVVLKPEAFFFLAP